MRLLMNELLDEKTFLTNVTMASATDGTRGTIPDPVGPGDRLGVLVIHGRRDVFN
jgi:hypothetical protein